MVKQWQKKESKKETSTLTHRSETTPTLKQNAINRKAGSKTEDTQGGISTSGGQ